MAYNKFLGVSGDKVVIHLLINLRFIVIVVYYDYPFPNIQNSTSFFLSETNAKYTRYNIEMAI